MGIITEELMNSTMELGEGWDGYCRWLCLC